jgi:hypothetical protein
MSKQEPVPTSFHIVKSISNSINTTFYMDSDANGKDPDSYSPTLVKFHRYLWSKELPNGNQLELEIQGRINFFLTANREGNVYEFSSDRIVMTMLKWKRMKSILNQVNEDEIYHFDRLANTIGSYIIFPKNQINNKPTINAIRGMSSKIKNRFDLTLECIRLYYLNQESPLYDHLLRYKWFFDLFVDFEGYTSFFLLQDLLNKNKTIKFWLPFKSFYEKYSSIPNNDREYQEYMNSVIGFVKNRNDRINSSELN